MAKNTHTLCCFIALLLMCFLNRLISQNQRIDSFKLAIKTCKEDTNKLNLLFDLSRVQLLDKRFAEGLKTAKMVEALAKKLNSKKGLAKAFHCIGNAYIEAENYPEALNYHLKSLKIKEELGDLQGMAYSYNNLGKIYRSCENYKDAIINYSKSVQLKKELLEKAKLNGNPIEIKRLSLSIARTSDYIGSTYDDMKELRKALNSYNETQKIYEKFDDINGISGCYQNRGVIYYKLKNYDTALQHFLKVLDYSKDEEEGPHLAGVYLNIGTTYLELKEPVKARLFLDRSLKMSQYFRVNDVTMDNFAGLFELEKSLGNYKPAFLYYKQYIKYKDSISNKSMIKKMQKIQLTREHEKTEKEARLIQDKKDAISKEKSELQKIILLSICLVIVIVIGFGLYAWVNFKQKQKMNIAITRQKEIIEEKQKEILSSIMYAKRIQTSLLPSETYIEKMLEKLSNKSKHQ